ncbi:MAG: tetratricopeptide repeat protein [Nitrospirae bacterium]|nr:tetratricopeptide repeat protein [Nitrospirota bacterium]
MLEYYKEGLAYYRQGNWDNAAEAFNRTLHVVPQDKPSHVFINRCIEYSKNPPKISWDGVYEMKSK